MQYRVFVQNLADNSFMAAVVGMPNCIAEGATREEAVAKAKATLEAQLARGDFVTIDVENVVPKVETDPWIKNLGKFVDDPTYEDFLEEVAAYRRNVDAQEVEQ